MDPLNDPERNHENQNRCRYEETPCRDWGFSVPAIRPICVVYDWRMPHFVARRSAVTAEETEALLRAEMIFSPVFHGEFAPIAGHVAREKFPRVLSRLLERGQSPRRGGQPAQVKQWFICDFLHDLISPFLNFGFAVRRRGGRPRSRKQMPSWPGKAPVGRRCQGRGVCVHRSAAESLDRRSRRIRRRIWAGRAGELVF